jgi:hypothetical protein
MSEASTKSKAITTQEQAPQGDRLELQLLEQAKTPAERQLAFSLASQARQAKMIRDVAVAVAETGWGKEISPIARAAIVRYCLEIGADPVRHVHVLGGNVYMNAAFWMDLVAANPKFLRAKTEFIHDDKRADDEERERRKAQRLVYGVPEDAPGAAVVTLFYAGDRGPFIGVNWAGVRDKDPVGKAEPTKSAETRAYRRAAMKAEPAWFGKHPQLKSSQEVLVQGRELEKNGESLPEIGNTPVATESVEIGKIDAPRGGVIEKHQPSAICGFVEEHPRERCGYFHDKKEPPAS